MTTPLRLTDHSLVGTVVGCFVVPEVVPLHPPSAEYTQQEEIKLRLPNTHDITSFDMEICKCKLQNSCHVGRQEEEMVASFQYTKTQRFDEIIFLVSRARLPRDYF